MVELNLLKSYPRSKRNITRRKEARDPAKIALSKEFGEAYFDGDRDTGYGGYYYDGRWRPVAADIIEHYQLKPGSRVLDIGCAKGFLVKDLMLECPGLEVYGLDISDYALHNAPEECLSKLCRGDVRKLPFKDQAFDVSICINVIHNVDVEGCIESLKEMTRVAGRSFVQVDSWYNEHQMQLLLDWMLTPLTYRSPDGWREIFREAGYNGDYFWTITE